MAARKQEQKPIKSITGIPAACELVVDGKKISYDISGIELRQYIDDHHILKMKIRGLGQEAANQDFTASLPYTSFLGKSISLRIKPEGQVVDTAKGPVWKEIEKVGVILQSFG